MWNIKLLLTSHWQWIVVILFASGIFLRIKVRGFFWRARDGTELSLKEFFKFWGKGIEGITPLQQTRTQLLGINITLTGIIAGMAINALVRMKNVWWWVEIILLGSLILTLIQLISIYQKHSSLKKIEEAMKDMDANNDD